MTDPIIVVVRSGYTEAQKRATYKWNQKNTDKLREYRAKTYLKRKDQAQDFYQLGKLVEAVGHPEFRKKRAYRRKSEE